MNTTDHQNQTVKTNEGPSLGESLQTPYTQREIIETTLDSLATAGANLTQTIKACNGMERGSYRVVITKDADYNEVQIRLKEGPGARHAIATAYVDYGHTAEARRMAAEEIRGTVRAYLCR